MTTTIGPWAELAGKRAVVVNWRDLDHTLAGGAEIYAWQYARALREAGAEVSFLTARDHGQTDRAQRDGITVRRGGGTLGFYLFALVWLLRHRRHIDVVVDPVGGLPSFSPLVLRRSTPAVLIVHHVHQAQFGVHFPAPVAAFGRWMERVAMRRVYRRQPVVAVSESTAGEMRSQLGWSGAIGILENGADVPSYDVTDAVAKDPDRIVVLGRLVAQKRVDLALEAVARLGGAHRVDVVGRGPERARLEARAAALGLGDRVRFHGYLPSDGLATVLAHASVHLCASDAEGWGQTVIAAAAFGVPTVARDVPGLRDSIRPGETGWLVADDGDHRLLVGRLAEQLELACAEASEAEARVLRARACVTWARQFDWSQMREDARALTTDVLTGGAGASSDHHHPRGLRVAV